MGESSDVEVMRRHSARPVLAGGLVLAFCGATAGLNPEAWPGVPWPYPVLWAGLALSYGRAESRPRLRLTPGGLTVLGRRERSVLWTEITRFAVEDGRTLVVHLASGERVALPAPCDHLVFSDSRFPARTRHVAAAWAAARGLPPPLIAQEERPPGRWRLRRRA
ncbi:hypothetical protein AB0M28_31275 [Streptomyces sp. NPDC051940]|uniref:hypothetical protein n=1 Tax=Streptomyces sp. NPDC051940 TaxID=3155675 RepID=UPI00341FD38B